ncbi:MAG TPA: polyprenyl diphosphate synthase [Candidatus Dormibacteraeota bacterium]|nr:polyprenyl diphosphate synthase [Candidatus Dormibacteraeota bacterium]
MNRMPYGKGNSHVLAPITQLPAPCQEHGPEPRQSNPQGLHVAIISDGNGRWALARGLPRSAGHRAGAQAAGRVIRACPNLGIGTLTLFTLSSANWKRPQAEVNGILRLLHEYLLAETTHCAAQGVRLTVMGRRDRLSENLRQTIADAETATAAGTRLHVRLAVDYSAREAIYRAACRFYKVTSLSLESFSDVLREVNHDAAPDVDLLIRTGGEQRLSDFLLWEAAYAELAFVPKKWPDFSAEDLATAVAEFHTRARNFGGLPDAAAS